ncbi:GntR family transcriptional regulator [Microbacterium sp. Se5.02b]|uniref:GntR family transcriptional regulator n=1 Tax=Microbacterium sp. Se5.02b TaxID=2864103 RepID=UPI0037CC6DAD
MLIRVDPDSPRALFDQVAASVRSDILAGILAPGDRLPAARDVAEALDINQHTVLHAYQRLRDEGSWTCAEAGEQSSPRPPHPSLNSRTRSISWCDVRQPSASPQTRSPASFTRTAMCPHPDPPP